MKDKDLNKNAEILWNKKKDIDMLLTSLFSSIQNPDFTTFDDIKPTEDMADAVRAKIESVCEDIVNMVIELAERNKGG